MTTFEAAILLNEQFANNMTILSIYITLITGYIILAYNAGANLTKAQNIIVGILCSSFTLNIFLLNYSISVDRCKGSLLLKNYEVCNRWSLFGAVIEVSGIHAALSFMKNIRKSKLYNK